VCVCVFVSVLVVLGPSISKTVGDRASVPMDHQQEMTCGESNNHVLDDATLPVAGGRRCARLAEIAVSGMFFSSFSFALPTELLPM